LWGPGKVAIPQAFGQCGKLLRNGGERLGVHGAALPGVILANVVS
jgi:hypothetical protein